MAPEPREEGSIASPEEDVFDFGNLETRDYVESSQYHRRPSYITERDIKKYAVAEGKVIAAGSAYSLDPFTGNIIDGTEDYAVPEHILAKDELRYSEIKENDENIDENQTRPVSSSERLLGKLRSSGHGRDQSARSSRRSEKSEKRIREFYGSLSDPKTRMTISWKDVTYSVKGKKKGEMKQILFGLDGQARPGEVVGIIGSSGAGKTTLLNILAGRVSEGEIGGKVVVNGRKRGPQWRRVIGYVEQEDLFYRTLTVKETLSYSALLRLPRYLSTKQKLERVDVIIKQLGLEKCQDTVIGDDFTRGISGGERKRVSIGVELIANPKMIFMDEPTTGLDAFTAFQLIQNTATLATDGGKTVIMTIHQPREDILFLFDKILLMSQGKMVFFGPTQSALDHMDSMGFPCPIYQNPANFFIDMISIDFKERLRKQEQEGFPMSDASSKASTSGGHSVNTSQNRVSFLQAAWESKKKHELIRRGIFENNSIADSPHPATQVVAEEKDPTSTIIDRSANNYWIPEFWILLERYMIDGKRNKIMIAATLGQQIVMFLLVGFTFFQLPLNQQGIQSRIGVLFLITINNVILIMQPLILSFPLEKPIIKKERWSSAYRNSSLYAAKALSIIPLRLVVTIIYGLSVYYVIGLNPGADRYFIFQLILLDIVFNSQALGLAISASVPTVQMGQVIGPLIFLILLIYAGNFVGITIPVVIAWIKYLSTARYAYTSFAQNEFAGETYVCSDGKPPINGTICLGGGYATGDQVLNAYSLNELPIYTNLLILLGFTVFFHIFALVALYITTKPRSKII